MINKSHFLAALCGIEKNLGRISPPLRLAFNYAEKKYLKEFSIIYLLIVMGNNEKGELETRGLYAGEEEKTFIKAAKLSQKLNIHLLDKPLKKIVAYMDTDEFKSTWVANKAIYRTRMAIADGGELLIIAPGLKSFGENSEIDHLIRKYGYIGTPAVLKAVEKNEDLRENLVASGEEIFYISNPAAGLWALKGQLTA